MKKMIIFVCILFIKSNLFGQQITATFSADNSYAVYKGNPNNVTSKILPAGNSNGTSNSSNQQIFSPTTNTIQITNNEWLYLIAWSDDAVCQGLIGEFTGDRILKTGDSGWQVYATGKNYGDNQSPTMSEINSHIQLANTSNAWTTPFVGPTNANGTQVCSGWRKVNGISDDAKWIWYNSTNQNSATTVFSSGINHKEYLIFRFPVRVINTPTPNYSICCPPTIDSTDIDAMIEETSGNNYTFRVVQSPDFNNRISAYGRLLQSINPCIDRINVTWRIYNAGSANEPQYLTANNQVISNPSAIFQEYNLNNGNTPTVTPNIFNNQIPYGQWVRVIYGLWTSSSTDKNCKTIVPKECSEHNWYFRKQVNVKSKKIEIQVANSERKVIKTYQIN